MGRVFTPQPVPFPKFSRQLITHRFRAMSCFYTPVIYQSKAGLLAVITGRGVIFLCLYSDDVSHGSTPSPRIPYRVLGSAHCDHVHTPPFSPPLPSPHPSLPRRSVPRAHKHTYTPVVSALPIQTADSGGSGRGKGGGEVGQRPCSPRTLLCNLHLRAFDNLEHRVQNLLQILERLLIGRAHAVS